MMAGNQCRVVCRTCLRVDHLVPIFPRSDLHERYTLALFLTTGLQIEMDDGLPQNICKDCIKLINAAIDFRNQTHKSERQLLRWGHRRKVETSCYALDHGSMDSTNIKQETYERDHDIKRENLSPPLPEFNVEIVDRMKHEVKLEKDEWSSENLDSPDEELPTAVTVPELSKKSMNDKIYERYQSLTDQPIEGPVRSRRGPYKCKACKKILKNWATFRLHAKLHLGFDLMCEYCGKKFKVTGELKMHHMTHHGAERTFRCRLCDHRALDKERLQIHVGHEHTGDRPYVCDTCGASFFRRRCLVYHLDVHITNKTVKCSLCPAKFKSGQQLHCHTSMVHRRQGWRYECYLCDNTYTKRAVARRHIEKVHGVPMQKQTALRRMQPTRTTQA